MSAKSQFGQLQIVHVHLPSEDDEGVTPAGPMERKVCAIKIRHGSSQRSPQGRYAAELCMSPLIAVTHNAVTDIATCANLLDDNAQRVPLGRGHADLSSGVVHKRNIAAPGL
jgi:hypothetical protein